MQCTMRSVLRHRKKKEKKKAAHFITRAAKGLARVKIRGVSTNLKL